jgi:glucose/arabinose dehydrogenase
MRKFLIAAASLLVCSPAFAQTSANSPSEQNSLPSEQNSQTASPQTESKDQAQPQQTTVNIALQIKNNLEHAGFKNIKLVPSAFIVRADDQNDNPVVMVVNPGSITSVSEKKGASAEGNNHGTVGQGESASPDRNNPSDMNNSNGSASPDH